MDYEDMTPGELLAEANVAEFVKNLALGIAEAQRSLDKNSIEQAILLANTTLPGTQRSLLELGFSPVFYHFQYADIEVSMHLKLAVETALTIGGSLGVGFESNQSSTSETTGTATITVLHGTSTPAMAIVLLDKPAAATLVVGGSTIVVDVASASPAPDVAVVPSHVHATAQDLATHLISSSVPEITNATTRLFPNGDVNPTTGCTSVFVCTPNRIGVNAVVLGSAYEWVEILQVANGKMKLLGADEASWGPGLDLSATATAMVADVIAKGYDASLIVDDGKAICVPHFDFNQSYLMVGDIPDLDALAMWLSNDTSVANIVLEGYADLTGGNSSYNLALSDDRAETVKSYLVGRGVDPLKITVIPRGATNSLGTGDDADDRRVEISFPKGPKNVVAIHKNPGGTWTPSPFTPATVGKVLAKLDAPSSLPCDADDTWVMVKGKKYEIGSGPQKFAYTPADAVATAASLAAAISSDTSAGGAFAFVDPPGSSQIALVSEDAYVEIRMLTSEQSAAANATTLKTTGALSIRAIFDGGSDLAFVTQNDQIAVAGTTYTAVTGVPGPDQFEIGPGNADTAANLASAINASKVCTAVASGGVVTITGPAGSLVSTTNPSAFKLSDDKLSGSAMQPVETNRSVAVAASFDARYSKQFGLEMEGNSRIAARLVAIPAPPELLAEIKKYLT